MKKLLFLTALTLTFSNLFSQETPQKDTIITPKPGDLIEGFYMLNVDGMYFSPQDFPDSKGFIIVFTCNHCPFSQAYESRIIELDNKYSKKGYPVIAINPNDPKIVPEDSYDKMKERSDEYGYPFPYLVDENGVYARKLGALKTPHVFVTSITESGLRIEYIGAIDDNSENASGVKKRYVESAVNALISGKQVILNQTKAIGCSVKFSKN
jgi:thiol-disulfide isomerase/thioredoxin